MIRKVVRTGNPKLKAVSKAVKSVDKKVLNLIKDLSDTLKVQKDPEGVGLAACQIGENARVFVMVTKEGKIKPVINPEIIDIDKGTKKASKIKGKSILEGCLSLPNYYGPLKRAQKITIKYLNTQGKEITETFSGMEAQIVQHEIDHLNGIMFLQRLFEQKKPLYKLEGEEWEEVNL